MYLLITIINAINIFTILMHIIVNIIIIIITNHPINSIILGLLTFLFQCHKEGQMQMTATKPVVKASPESITSVLIWWFCLCLRVWDKEHIYQSQSNQETDEREHCREGARVLVMQPVAPKPPKLCFLSHHSNLRCPPFLWTLGED